MFENASYIAAGIAGLATIFATWLNLRGGFRAAQLAATASSLDAQLRGWQSYCDSLRESINELRKENFDIRKDLRAAEERTYRAELQQEQCESNLIEANRRIKVLDDRLSALETPHG